MASRQESTLAEGAGAFLEDGEEILAAFPMALAITQRRLLSFEIGSPIGTGVGVTGLVEAFERAKAGATTRT